MKQMLVAVSALVLMTGVGIAENEQRINQGTASGQLNGREASWQNEQQEQVNNKMENRAKSDAVMTDKERARIAAAQDRAARHIAREKHDRQGKRRR